MFEDSILISIVIEIMYFCICVILDAHLFPLLFYVVQWFCNYDVILSFFFILICRLISDQYFFSQLPFLMILAVLIFFWLSRPSSVMLLGLCAWFCASRSAYMHGVFMVTCLSLCSRVKELKRAREHETPQKSPLAMWHHSPDSFFFFFVCTWDILQQNRKKETINANTANINMTAVLLVQLLLHVQQRFLT